MRKQVFCELPFIANASVLSPIPHLITLFAFVAHIVLGCCVHHDHRGAANCRQQLVHLIGEHSAAQALHDCCEHSPSPQDCVSQGEQISWTAPVVASWLGLEARLTCPNGHAHECAGRSCIYVDNGWRASDYAQILALTVCETQFLAALLRQVTHVLAADAHCSVNATCYPSQSRCVLFQLWQI